MRPTNQLDEWEWIEAYHRGLLVADERQIFEQELRRDADFRQTSEQLRLALHTLQTLGLEHTVRRAVQRELAATKPQRRWRILSAASTLLVFGLLSVGYLSLSRVNLNTYRNDIALTQRYRESIADSNRTDFTNQQRNFYRDFFDAQAYMANGQPKLAIENLEKLARTDSLRPYFRQAVEWHLLNAYLLSNQPDNAGTTLKMIDQAGILVYPINRTDHWKVWWQIRWQKLMN